MQAIHDTLIGQTLGGRYAIERVAAQEHLGPVYAARDLHGAAVHVKVLHPSFVHDPRKFARFGREITATWLISHPNTVEVLDWGQQDDVHYLVTEPVEGETLADLLAGGPLPPDRVAPIVAQVASAIGAAHQEGIVHRALVPRNVVVLADDRVKVRDFGMSKLEQVEDDEGGTQTTLTTRIEDLAYMAPEYLDAGTFLKKSDLYSLGALAYHMLTGKAPSAMARATPRSARLARVPPWLDELVADLLQPDPTLRPGAYRVVRRIEAGTGRALDPARAPVDEAVGEPERPHTLAVTVGLAVMLAVLFLGGAVIVLVGVAVLLSVWVAL